MNFIMNLDDGQVARHFGAHPERGRRLTTHTLIRTAGVRWTNFGRLLEPVPVKVNPIIVLHNVKRGVWRVTCDEAFRNAAEAWLSTYCQRKEVRKPRKRRYQRTYTWKQFSGA